MYICVWVYVCICASTRRALHRSFTLCLYMFHYTVRTFLHNMMRIKYTNYLLYFHIYILMISCSSTDHLEQHLTFPHAWIRLVSAQLFGMLFAAWQPSELATPPSDKKSSSFYLQTNLMEKVNGQINNHLGRWNHWS